MQLGGKGGCVEPIRWGILGTGGIADKFATGLQDTPDAVLAAVGSRTIEAASAFAGRFGNPRTHGSYQDLVNDPDVDIIYVATPHPIHHSAARLCLEAGKAVLCEKPFTLNAGEAADLIAYARERKLFLMEAMWSRFLPAAQRFRQLVADGAIGEPRILHADFGFRGNGDPNHRLFAPSLGGGALLDVGVYVTSMASWIFGRPQSIASFGHIGDTAVDEQVGLLFGYEGGALSQLTAAVRTNTPQAVTLMGTEGSIRIHPLWWKPTTLTLSRSGQDDETIELPFEGNGYNYEAAEAGRCLREGLLESPGIPLDETLAIMETLDAVRAQWGLTYPMERL
jgi:predicted dehydrogenase